MVFRVANLYHPLYILLPPQGRELGHWESRGPVCFCGDPQLLPGLRPFLICQRPPVSQYSIAWKAFPVSFIGDSKEKGKGSPRVPVCSQTRMSRDQGRRGVGPGEESRWGPWFPEACLRNPEEESRGGIPGFRAGSCMGSFVSPNHCRIHRSESPGPVHGPYLEIGLLQI